MLTTWLSVAAICTLGAMSPGPSLAVVLRHTLRGGRSQGCAAAVAHSIGIGIYALLAISGLAVLITASPAIFSAFQWVGAAYLAWLGIKGLLAKPVPEGELAPPGGTAAATMSAVRDGFLVAFLNPKIAVFLIALFSQVVGADTSWPERSLYAGTAWLIDMLWYLLVATLFSNPRWLQSLQRNAVWFERAFGVILLALAGRLIIEVIA
jgi:threonine/homoserine/homoserine lactone efflux protein